MTTDVTHDPRTDWCACEPEGADRCDYRLLADAVIAGLDVHDGDEAEVALCISAVEHAAAERDEARAKLAKAEALIGQLERITTAWTRGMYAARVDCWRGDIKAAAAILDEGLDAYDGPEWDGTESGAQWWERTKAEEGL